MGGGFLSQMKQYRYYTMVACPIKEIFCQATKPREVTTSSLNTTKGACRSCSNALPGLENIRKIFGIGVKIKRTRMRGNKQRFQVLVACPLKGPNCSAKNPRFIWTDKMETRRGACQSCTKYKGGWLDRNGYKRIYANGKSTTEHRYVMEKILGRKLKEGETVHHKNAKRNDNRPDNLEVRMSGNHPQGWTLAQMRDYLYTVPKHLGGLK